MFDISFSELLVILIVALVVFGPKNLPEMAYKFGLFVERCKQFMTQINHELSYRQIVNDNINEQHPLDATNQQNINSITTHTSDVSYYQPELNFDGQLELF
jgi:sec-independent protein translocase protein TatB